jgi:hypothetical protein
LEKILIPTNLAYTWPIGTFLLVISGR